MSSGPAATPRSLWLAATVFTVGTAVWSWWRWWTFQYGTFDIAFYVQALWLALRGEWHVSLLDVPLLGNHAEPIVFLFVPLFAICPHPMLLVVVQALALATAPFTAWRIARKLGLEPRAATPLALATLLTPASTFIALHEFHPEAFAFPLLLLLADARLAERAGFMWLWWVLLLACKENLALLLVAWAGVHTLLEWRRGWPWQWRWNLLPLAAAAAWLAFYTRVLSPALNGGNVDYLELYSHLGRSAPEIARGFVFEPGRALAAVANAITHGDLVWGTLVPMLALPLLRPRWGVICLAVLLPHLLSWRASEWSMRLHYGAPIVALLWLGAAEAVARIPRPVTISWLVVGACLFAQALAGPFRDLPGELATAPEALWRRTWKSQEINAIANETNLSVTACQPYLSHLAERRELHSLHHVLKGLKTLSRERYVPRPVDAVVIDYEDRTTFSVESGFYHPRMRTANSQVVPSSDELLHRLLRERQWEMRSINELSVFRAARKERAPEASVEEPISLFGDLRDVEITRTTPASPLQVSWTASLPREGREFAWVQLVLPETREVITRGLLAPALTGGVLKEEWQVLRRNGGAPLRGAALLVYDHAEAAWANQLPPFRNTHVLSVHPLPQVSDTPRP